MRKAKKKQSARPAMRSGAASEPLYAKLVQAIKQEIKAGRAPIGALLPSEIELGRQHTVSRHTVREALRHLRMEGLVAPRKGSGTTVVSSGPTKPYVHEVASIEQLVQYATGTQYEVGTSKIVRADFKLTQRLGCAEGEQWMRIEGLRYAPGQGAPICWMEVYIHADYANVLRMIGKRPGPIYAWIEDMHGVHINEIEQVLSARDVPAALSKKLEVKAGSMGIEVRRTYRLDSGKIAEIAFNLHPAHRFRYAMTLRRNQGT
ncbi:MAG TPA: GntR family transcriptional regulator [Bradyrhizobium sp.]|jgi:DNA-binding GntR family transcriptional regulator